MKTNGDTTPPPKSVIESVHDRTGDAPNVMLPESDSSAASPYVDPQGVDASLLPKGRGNYQIHGEIARGGMGIVLKGRDTDLGREVALKVLDPELAKRPAILQRFVEEAQIGGQLQHPGVVPVYELGLMADDRPYFTMKLIKGRTLSALLGKRDKVGDDRLEHLSAFEDVCQTVAYAHSKGVIHRDLKPANIMVGAFGEVQVVDWGLAKVLKQGGNADEERVAEKSRLTIIETVRSGPGSDSDSLSGAVMGTPAYMAPEQARGELERVDERSDVFALGAILCEILTGKPPYVSSTGAGGREVVELAAGGKLEPARQRIEACGADPALVTLCLDCLAPSRDGRPREASIVAERVHGWIASTEQRAHEANVRAVEEGRRRRLTIALATVTVLALGLGGGGWIWVDRLSRDRAEQVRVAVDETHELARGQQEQGQLVEALETARRAERLAEPGDAALRARALEFTAHAEQRVTEAAAAADLERRNRELLVALEDVRILQEIDRDPKQAEAACLRAFRAWGVDLSAADLSPALETLRESGVAEDVALAFDQWAMERRAEPSVERHAADVLMHLAIDLDPNPVRLELRRAIIEGDEAALLELSEPEVLHTLPARTLVTLSWALFDVGAVDARARVVRAGARLHPDDVFLNVIAGRQAWSNDRFDLALSHFAAAQALRPGNAVMPMLLGETLIRIGRWPDAARAFEETVARDPDDADAFSYLGGLYTALGDHRAAKRSWARGMEVAPRNDELRFGHTAARYALGELSHGALLDALERARLSDSLTGALLLRNPSAEDVALAVEHARDLVRSRPGFPPHQFLLIEALVLAEGMERQVFAACEAAHAQVPTSNVMFRALSLFARAIAHARLGEDEPARSCLAQALRITEDLTGTEPEAWDRSLLIRMRAIALETVNAR